MKTSRLERRLNTVDPPVEDDAKVAEDDWFLLHLSQREKNALTTLIIGAEKDEVTDEAFDQAYQELRRRSEKRAGKQHPAFKHEFKQRAITVERLRRKMKRTANEERELWFCRLWLNIWRTSTQQQLDQEEETKDAA